MVKNYYSVEINLMRKNYFWNKDKFCTKMKDWNEFLEKDKKRTEQCVSG